jgi:hypothetical protein
MTQQTTLQLTDCDVITKLWHLFCYRLRSRESFPARQKIQWKNILAAVGGEKTYFPLHSVIKFTFISWLLRSRPRITNKINGRWREKKTTQEAFFVK